MPTNRDHCLEKLEELVHTREELIARLLVLLKSRVHDRIEDAESEFRSHFGSGGYGVSVASVTSTAQARLLLSEGSGLEARKGDRTVRLFLPFLRRIRSRPEYSFFIEYFEGAHTRLFRIPLLDPGGPHLSLFRGENEPNRRRIALLCSDRSHTVSSYMDQIFEEISLLKELLHVDYRFPPLLYGVVPCPPDLDPAVCKDRRHSGPEAIPLHSTLTSLLCELDRDPYHEDPYP